MSVYDKWNKNMDIEGLKADIAEADNNSGGDYAEIPVGTYEVKIDNMEIKDCKSEKHAGEALFSVQFRILEGQYKNSCIFMNQLLSFGWAISKVKDFIRSLEVVDDNEVVFEEWNQFGNLIERATEIANANFEYLLEYGKNNKGYNTFKIKEVYEIEG